MDAFLWRASINSPRLDRLASASEAWRSVLSWKRYEDEVPAGRKITNIWAQPDVRVRDKRYVVQTADSVIERCILMSTGPGDLVFDPTCGGATTALVAERWGRRWITCDTSPIAVSIARQRISTATFDYWALADSEDGAHQESEIVGGDRQPRHRRWRMGRGSRRRDSSMSACRRSRPRVLAYDLDVDADHARGPTPQEARCDSCRLAI